MIGLRACTVRSLKVLLVLAFCACSGGGTQGTGSVPTERVTIEGTILTANNGPLPGATITIANTGSQAVTDSSGAFLLETEPLEGDVQLEIQGAAGQSDISGSISIEDFQSDTTAAAVTVRADAASPSFSDHDVQVSARIVGICEPFFENGRMIVQTASVDPGLTCELRVAIRSDGAPLGGAAFRLQYRSCASESPWIDLADAATNAEFSIGVGHLLFPYLDDTEHCSYRVIAPVTDGALPSVVHEIKTLTAQAISGNGTVGEPELPVSGRLVYRIEAIATGAQQATASDINDRGAVIGSYDIGPGQLVGFFFDGNGLRTLTENLSGGSVAPTAVNNKNQVVGFFGGQGYLLRMDGTETLLPGYSFSTPAIPHDINDSTIIVGAAGLADTTSFVAALYTSSTGPLEIFVHDRLFSSANGINEKSEVVGTFEADTGKEEAFYFAGWPDPFNPNNEIEGQGIGTLGGLESAAFAINNDGKIVGEAETAAGDRHAFLYTAIEGMRDLATLGGNSSRANDINDRGIIVGRSFTANGDMHAFVYSDAGGMEDLNAMIGDVPGWQLREANAINERGEIAGEGRFNGKPTAFKLTPITE